MSMCMRIKKAIFLCSGIAFAALALPPTTSAQAQDMGTADVVKMYHENNPDKSITLFADNTAFCPTYIHVTLPVLTNLSTSIDTLPYEAVLPPRSSRNALMILHPINKKGGTQFRYAHNYFFGDPFNTTPDSSHLYWFPFASGESFEVQQGFNGTFSHFGELHLYAIDFKMPEGTPVYAARAGIVVDIKKDSEIGGNDRRYWDDANYILICHSDGTFGTYLHLKRNGAVVAVGQTVRDGEILGYSGNTGFSDVPHLHFSVSVPQRNSDRKSIPFQFLGHNQKGVVPQKGRLYKADHPSDRR